MKNRFAIIIDGFFLFAFLFLFSFLISIYFVDKLYVALLASVVFSLLFFSLLGMRTKKRRKKEKDEFEINLLVDYFSFMSDEEILDYFFCGFRKKYELSRKNDCLKINDTLIFCSLSEKLTLKKVVNCYVEAKKESAKTVVILSFMRETLPENLENRLCDARICLFSKQEVLRLIKSLEIMPNNLKTAKRRDFLLLLKNALQPKRAKGYLFVAFVLLFGAYFSFYSVYFIVMAALNFTLVVLCKLDIATKLSEKKEKKMKKDEI